MKQLEQLRREAAEVERLPPQQDETEPPVCVYRFPDDGQVLLYAAALPVDETERAERKRQLAALCAAWWKSPNNTI